MPFAGDGEVLVAAEDDASRPAQPGRGPGSEDGRLSRLRLLAAEAAPHAFADAHDLGLPQMPSSVATTVWISSGFCVDEWIVTWPASPGIASAACGSR